MTELPLHLKFSDTKLSDLKFSDTKLSDTKFSDTRRGERRRKSEKEVIPTENRLFHPSGVSRRNLMR